MASIVKIRKKKGVKGVGPTKVGITEKDETSCGGKSQDSSLISVKEAAVDDQHDSVEKTLEGTWVPMPGTNAPVAPDRPLSASQRPSTSAPDSHPNSALSQRSQKASAVAPFGSLSSLKSREAWVDQATSRPSSALSRNSTYISNNRPPSASTRARAQPSRHNSVHPDPGQQRPGSAQSRQSAVPSISVSAKNLFELPQEVPQVNSLGPPEMNESHAYVPYVYARDSIAKIMEDMKNMKFYHVHIVHDIEDNYRSIEDETQAQYNMFVISLREQYGIKVKTFRQVIEVHRLELQQKDQYWDEALISLSSRNKRLLQDKKVLLIQNKVEFERLEAEKNEAVQSLTSMLDQTNAKLTYTKRELEFEHKEKVDALSAKQMEESKILTDALETEKKENESLKEEIEELRRQQLLAGGTAIVASVQSSRRAEPDVVVADMSEEDRLRMEEERKRMKAERDMMVEDRKKMDEDRDVYTQERRKFQEEHILLQGDLTSAIKGQEEWKFKYEHLKGQLGELADIKAKYDALYAQFITMSAMAAATSVEDKRKADEKIAKAQADREIMAEEQHQMEQELKKWEAEFKEKNGHEPQPKDRPDSIQELVVSKQEADAMVTSLDTTISTLETLKDGKVPELPTVVATPIDIKEPEIQTIEVKVPDPEVVAQLQASQAEVDQLKTSLSASKDEVTGLQSRVSELQSELSQFKAEIAKLEAKMTALEKQKAVLEAKVAAAAVGGVPASASLSNDALEMKLKEQEKQLRLAEKEKRALEKDIKKFMKAEAKQGKQEDNERTKRLLKITVREVHAVHGNAEKAAKLVADRLKRATGDKTKVGQEQENVSKRYTNWANTWRRDHDTDPTPAERDADNEGKKLFSDLETATADADDHGLTIQALEMISTGVVPEEVVQKPVHAAVTLAIGSTATAVITDELEALRQVNEDLEEKLEELEAEREELIMKAQELERELEELKEVTGDGLGVAVGAAIVDDVGDLNKQISELQGELDDADARLSEERSAHSMTREELEAVQAQVVALRAELEAHQDSSKADLEAATGKLAAEISNLQVKLSAAEIRAEGLDKERLANVPVDAQKEIQELKSKVAAAQKETDLKLSKVATLEAEMTQLKAKLTTSEKANNNQKVASSDSEQKLKQLKTEKDKELKELTAKYDKREKDRSKQEEKKISALERKIQQLEVAAGAAAGAGAKGKAGGKPAPDKAMQEKLRELSRELKEAQAKTKYLEGELKKLQKESGGSSVEADREKKKQEKVLKELEKKLEIISKKNEKNEQNLKKREEELDAAVKENTAKEKEVASLQAQLAALGIAAAEGVEAAAKVTSLEAEVKRLTEENKTLADNFNSERVLRKKYYNMVEDMKGKIRVYCRVRPLGRTEKDRGNYSICKSPDEYTISLDSNRGLKEFQFDTIFMPEQSQEKVFEDTHNLVQSAVDGYNVCIFAYGQTGSGKTYTIIGESSGDAPGIAPRAFDRIFELLEENKSKFSYKVQVYMLELYNDKLLDLFSKAGHSQEEKMDIKKDKKGMVVVQGAEVKGAKNSKELMGLFDEGSKSRHTACTKMNAESSRSHLVVGITIETTNKASGQVTKGKLSLVDLAGSERAAKTGALAEQLKEAMSINKSLSALGDVISALSSEQSYIPYRNNKLTMLMQDSLGGNAKTLMFVNISPADYNVDESVISLTYASRVKLITNDATKNADNKEIARLKNVIAKLKTGESVEEEETLEEPEESEA